VAKVLIIAELGLNHNGDFDMAKRMIQEAKECSADVAKFQYYDPVSILGVTSPYLSYALQCQFTKKQHEELAKHCKALGIEYLVSVFDQADIEWADKLCKRHKVASRMNKDSYFLDALVKTKKQVIMSIQKDTSTPYWAPFNLTYMHCITKYPCAPEDFKGLKFDSEHGLSSHCPSIQPSIDAVKQGARILENHVTFSRDLEGCDQKASLTFGELKEMVNSVRNA
jgi:sialic acid synthase SpsE